MINTVKWAILLSVFGGGLLADSQTYTAGSATMDYDSQSNTLIATCTIDASYNTQAEYGMAVDCGINITGTPNPLALPLAASTSPTDGIVEYTPTIGVSYTAWGAYVLYSINLVFINEEPYFYDPYDYSYYENTGTVDYGEGGYTWDGFDVAEVVTSAIFLGEVSSPTISFTTTYGANTLGSQIVGNEKFCNYTPSCSSGTPTCGSISWTTQQDVSEPCSYYVKNTWGAVRVNGVLTYCIGLTLPATGSGPCD